MEVMKRINLMEIFEIETVRQILCYMQDLDYAIKVEDYTQVTMLSNKLNSITELSDYCFCYTLNIDHVEIYGGRLKCSYTTEDLQSLIDDVDYTNYLKRKEEKNENINI